MSRLMHTITGPLALLIVAISSVMMFAGAMCISSAIEHISKNPLPLKATHSARRAADRSTLTIRTDYVALKIFKDLTFQILSPYMPKSEGGVVLPRRGNLSEISLANSSRREYFRISAGTIEKETMLTVYGESKVVSFSASSKDGKLTEEFRFILPLNFANAIICTSSLKNESKSPLKVETYSLLASSFDARKFGADSAYKFWSFQGGSYEQRYDWIFPITAAYQRTNFQGMNAPDYGGGIPVVDLWTRSMGLAFSVINTEPQFIYLPVRVKKSGDVSFSIVDSNRAELRPGESLDLVRYAIIVHHGDFFNGLKTYSDLMQDEGFHFPKAPADAFEPEWCAWGYGRDFSKKEILESLPLAKKLGFGWVTIDDGWQSNTGDWEPNPARFPGGENDFESFVDSIHSYGLKVRLWWSPFAAQDSTYSSAHYPRRMHEYGFNIQSKLALEHPDWFILDKDGNRVRVSWWNSYLLCPAVPAVRHYFEDFVRKAIVKWKIDGFKLDGQDQNMVPECFNMSHHHTSPFASVRAVPIFFKDIYDEATSLKKGFLVQLCPCGTNFSIYNLPYVNQTVASDPLDSWQVKSKGKTFRALYGSSTEAYSGDHVELTNRTWDPALQKFVPHGNVDFASTLAVGGVPASKFTIPGASQPDSTLALQGKQLKYYERWMRVYKREKLSRGHYLNLYDIAYYKPETHVIERGGNFYYFFFTKGHFSGKVTLRGLTAKEYRASNVYSGKILAIINSSNPTLDISFNHYMVVKLARVVRSKMKMDGKGLSCTTYMEIGGSMRLIGLIFPGMVEGRSRTGRPELV